jgi:hypothetical protein
MKMKLVALGALLLTLPALAQKAYTIRVAPLVSNHPMEQDMADVMTAKIIAHLTAAGVSVVEGESDTETDAVLKVSYLTRSNESSHVVRIEGPVRLTDIGGKVIWADEVRSRLFTRNPSTDFAENVALKVEAFLAHYKVRPE